MSPQQALDFLIEWMPARGSNPISASSIRSFYGVPVYVEAATCPYSRALAVKLVCTKPEAEVEFFVMPDYGANPSPYKFWSPEDAGILRRFLERILPRKKTRFRDYSQWSQAKKQGSGVRVVRFRK